MDFERVIHACRLELEQAGNPAFVAVVVDGGGATHLAPIVYATVRPASEHGARMRAAAAPGETAFVVSRQAQGQRVSYAILEPATMRKVHEQLEVIERSVGHEAPPTL